jgi:DNA polymerase III gamma/tau subunit
MVFYRKYRPQSLSELIGQTQISQTLQKAFESGRLSHAYLFCGPRGTGKTSTARILAKMINCEQSSVISHQPSAKNNPDLADSRKLKADSEIPCNQCDPIFQIPDIINTSVGSRINLDQVQIGAIGDRKTRIALVTRNFAIC